MATVKTLETEVELLKREVTEMKEIHVRLDNAIDKIADVSRSLHTMLAVHEEKLMRQEDALEDQEKKLQENIMELHSRITTNAKEQTQQMGEMERRMIAAMKDHNRTETEQFQKLREEISNRVGILEKWRWIIIGGSIVMGFIIQKLPLWG
jgi:tRNA U34 5-carboxymethylaminomethyl modifying enzyme MnmG/GidA